MLLEMQTIQTNYEQSRGKREAFKWAFAIGTLGLGAIYLWATTSIIKEGEIGLRRDARGKMILLPPGRHSNFPWETYPVEPQSLSQELIHLGPMTIVSVHTGFVAKSFNKGQLELLESGQHLLKDASHFVIKDKNHSPFISLKEITRKLDEVQVYTRDNVGLTIKADVRYQIIDPMKAITNVEHIETSIMQIAEYNIAQVVAHYGLSEFAPVTAAVSGQSQSNDSGMDRLIKELMGTITDQFQKLGIKLVNIGITSWTIEDTKLAHELAQGAVIQSKIKSDLLVANQQADIRGISAKAEAAAMVAAAEAEASAIKLKGDALHAVAVKLGADPVAMSVYRLNQHVEMVAQAKNANLFFGNGQEKPVVTVPMNNMSK